MAIQETRTRPPKFIEDLGEDLAKQITAQSGVPTVATGIAGISRQPKESDEDFAARQQAAREFTTRQESLKGLRPTVAPQDQLQIDAQDLAKEGIGSFQPFLDRAAAASKAARTGLEGIGLGPITAQQLSTIDRDKDSATFGETITPTLAEGSFMSPYQAQVIDATLAEFDRNVKKQELQIKDQAAKLGVLGTGRAGVRLGEFDTGVAIQKALLEAQLRQQGFQQAQAARQQDIANRFGLAQAQQGLGSFEATLGGQQQAMTGRDVAQLGTLGALNQAQEQARRDADREAARQAAFLPQQNLDRFAAQITGLMGGYPGQTTQTAVPNPTPLQTALGIGTTLAGIYGATNPTRNLFGPGNA